jgi:capsular exopolysaccharide synthesis family protein
MSKIFEALQRSIAERNSLPLSEAPDIATELLQETEEWQLSVSEKADLPFFDAPASATEPIHETEKTASIESCSALIPNPSPESRVVAITEPGGIAAEKFRLLAVRLRNLKQKRELKRVLVTSALPDEGKSVMAMNLACTLARYKQLRVLLVEGDMRRPKIQSNLGLPPMKGLSEWLRSDLPISEVIYHVNSPGLNLWLLPAGEPISDPVELMQSGRLAAVLDRLTEWFDWIIIDSTPILPVADTGVWARLSQGILMVVREARTEKRQLRKALDALESSTLLGVILNSSSNNEHKSYYTYYGASRTDAIPEQGE